MDLEVSILTCLAGVACKVYDDMNDNKLYERSSYLTKHKDYINEFLKGVHYILFTICLIKNPIFLFNVSTFMVGLFMDKEGFHHPYEFSGTIASCFLCVYIYYTNSSLFSLSFTLLYIVSLIISDYFFYAVELNPNNVVEYSYNKLFTRIFYTFILLPAIIGISFINTSIAQTCWYYFGYLLTSCLFQLYLLSTDTPKSVVVDVSGSGMVVDVSGSTNRLISQ